MGFEATVFSSARSSLLLNAGNKATTVSGTSSNVIVLNAQEGTLNWSIDDADPGFYVRPVKDSSGTANLRYDPDSGEITYDSSIARRRLEEQEDFAARIAELEAQVKALTEAMQALRA
jgi:outer membrane murein-binding lipoprotein Lpp